LIKKFKLFENNDNTSVIYIKEVFNQVIYGEKNYKEEYYVQLRKVAERLKEILSEHYVKIEKKKESNVNDEYEPITNDKFIYVTDVIINHEMKIMALGTPVGYTPAYRLSESTRVTIKNKKQVFSESDPLGEEDDWDNYNESHSDIDPYGEEDWGNDNGEFKTGDKVVCERTIFNYNGKQHFQRGKAYSIIDSAVTHRNIYSVIGERLYFLVSEQGVLMEYSEEFMKKYFSKKSNESFDIHSYIDPYREEDWADKDYEIGEQLVCLINCRGSYYFNKGETYSILDIDHRNTYRGYYLKPKNTAVTGFSKGFLERTFVRKARLNENRKEDIDPYNEEDWEDKGLEGKRFKFAMFNMYEKKSENPGAKEIDYGYKLAVPQLQKDLIVPFEIMKATAYRVTRENWSGVPTDLLALSYIIEYEEERLPYHTLPVGFEVMAWDIEYVRVEDVNNMDDYVETLFRLNNKFRLNRCFVFDEDTPNEVAILYCEKLYEKIKEKYENTNSFKDVYMKLRIIKQD
jgi:hypothetical protein